MPSTDASAGDMIMEDAKPVAVLAAIKAHFSLAAVINILPAHMGNISAKVLTMVQMFPVSLSLTTKSPLPRCDHFSSSTTEAKFGADLAGVDTPGKRATVLKIACSVGLRPRDSRVPGINPGS